MEGPFVDQTFTIADMIQSGNISLPEPMVRWVENGNSASMMGGADKKDKNANEANPIGLVYADVSKRELYWLKGIKLQVLDENNKVLPTAEFICHMNLDVDAGVRESTFKDSQKVSNTRLITLTQGQTEVHFPEGYGLPVASFEPFRFTFQAANRTTDVHRRIKHLCTMEFIKDSDLKKPMTALAWYAPYITVNIDKTPGALAPDHAMHGPSCLGNTPGETAPNFVNGSVIKNTSGEHLVGHWAIPPGEHTYTSPITDERDFGFNKEDKIVHCVWSHIHPMCEEVTLNICDGTKKTPLWTVRSQTDTSHGLEIKHIEDLYSSQGIMLPKDKHYELTAKYANTTGQRQDSMVVQGIFYEDNKFVKPFFLPANLVAKLNDKDKTTTLASGANGSKTECNSLYCGIKAPVAHESKDDYGGSDVYPLFSKETDGPLLTAPKHVQVHTSAGNLNFTLDPTLAPIAATQIYKLFQSGAFGGSTLCRYDPGYFLQIGSADIKRNAGYRLPAETLKLLRRVPLEVAMQDKGKGLHKKWALDFTRNKAKDSAVSSFTIMLADEPHLDYNFTVFGQLDQDPESMATIKKITGAWSNTNVPYIVSASDKQSNWVAAAPPESVTGTAVAVTPTEMKKVVAQAAPKQGIAPVAERSSAFPESLPLFNAKTDGPLLTAVKYCTIETSRGNIHVALDPALAPMNATQMYRLFKAGVMNGTTISRYEPNFVMQADSAESKIDPKSKFDLKIKQMLRRIPLEVACQDAGRGLHKKGVLSMAHTDADKDSASTSFSILLGDAPHLDHKYSVFGHLVNDAETQATMDKIQATWAEKHPFVISVKVDTNSIAFNSK